MLALVRDQRLVRDRVDQAVAEQRGRVPLGDHDLGQKRLLPVGEHAQRDRRRVRQARVDQVERLLELGGDRLLMDHPGAGHAVRIGGRQAVNGHVVRDRPAAARSPLVVALDARAGVEDRTEAVALRQRVARGPLVVEQLTAGRPRRRADGPGAGPPEPFRDLPCRCRDQHQDDPMRGRIRERAAIGGLTSIE